MLPALCFLLSAHCLLPTVFGTLPHGRVSAHCYLPIRLPLTAYLLARALTVTVSDHGTESLLIFCAGDERAHHPAIVPCLSAVQHIQPEVVTICVRIPSQVTKVFHQHECFVVLSLCEGTCLYCIAHHQTPSARVVVTEHRVFQG